MFEIFFYDIVIFKSLLPWFFSFATEVTWYMFSLWENCFVLNMLGFCCGICLELKSLDVKLSLSCICSSHFLFYFPSPKISILQYLIISRKISLTRRNMSNTLIVAYCPPPSLELTTYSNSTLFRIAIYEIAAQLDGSSYCAARIP